MSHGKRYNPCHSPKEVLWADPKMCMNDVRTRAHQGESQTAKAMGHD